MAYAEIVGKAVEYRAGDTVLKGFLAFDSAIEGKRPAILVVHEWWGHNEYARKRARMLAALGYTAFAVDMYGNGKQALHPDEAGKFASALQRDWPTTQARFKAGIEVLSNHPSVDKGKIGAIGYCMGGGIVLEMARRGIKLDGVVSFHGSLSTSSPAEAGQLKAKILVLNGAEDPFVKAEDIAAFKNEMNIAKADYSFISYAGAKHSFTNSEANKLGEKFDLPLAYNEQADQQSWQEMTKFFANLFK